MDRNRLDQKTAEKELIVSLTKPELGQWLLDHGEKASRRELIWQGLYREGVKELSHIEGLKPELIQKLKDNFVLLPLGLEELQEGQETVKFLFRLRDGSLIETVLMRHGYGSSVCVTTQVGCNIGCRFCASGLLKKHRDLAAGEITAQILQVRRYLEETGSEEKLSHITVMGIGEPFDNYEALRRFLAIVTDQKGLCIAPSHITVSTSGLVPGILRFAREGIPARLAVSLHAPNDEIRSSLMPINEAYPLPKLFAAIQEYIALTNRRVFFEYIMIAEVNDQPEHALELARLLKPLGKYAYVNLIPYNPVAEKDFRRSEGASISRFFDLLMQNGVNAIIRRELGAEIDGACGQLRSRRLSRDGQQGGILPLG